MWFRIFSHFVPHLTGKQLRQIAFSTQVTIWIGCRNDLFFFFVLFISINLNLFHGYLTVIVKKYSTKSIGNEFWYKISANKSANYLWLHEFFTINYLQTNRTRAAMTKNKWKRFYISCRWLYVDSDWQQLLSHSAHYTKRLSMAPSVERSNKMNEFKTNNRFANN